MKERLLLVVKCFVMVVSALSPPVPLQWKDAPAENAGEEKGGPAEGNATDVLRMKRMSQIRQAVWCKGRIQVLVEVAVKGR